MTENSDWSVRSPPTSVIIGYSIPPPMRPSTAVMAGYGYGITRRERCSMENFSNSADRSHEAVPGR